MERKNGLPPVHPGEIVKEDILPSVGLSAAAKALGVSRQMLHEILAERRPLSAVMCLKVSRLFGSSPEMWMRLQATYGLPSLRYRVGSALFVSRSPAFPWRAQGQNDRL
jgi:addiction module HigA family antidote